MKRQERVYTIVVDNAKSETLRPVIKKKIMPDSIVYIDSLSSYDSFWKNANFGLTSAHRPNSLKSCGTGVEFKANLSVPNKNRARRRAAFIVPARPRLWAG